MPATTRSKTTSPWWCCSGRRWRWPRVGRGLSVASLALAVACQRGTGGADGSMAPAAQVRGAPLPAPGLRSAIRCGNCHDRLYDEWDGSAHARAARTALYVKMKEDARSAECDGCHD